MRRISVKDKRGLPELLKHLPMHDAVFTQIEYNKAEKSCGSQRRTRMKKRKLPWCLTVFGYCFPQIFMRRAMCGRRYTAVTPRSRA